MLFFLSPNTDVGILSFLFLFMYSGAISGNQMLELMAYVM